MKIPHVDPIAIELMEAARASRSNEGKRHYLGMSSIGDPCRRKLWFRFRGVHGREFDGKTIMIFRFGDRIEEEIMHWVKLWFSKTKYNKISGQQLEFSAHHGFFRGHCDGVVGGITSKKHILEIKSCNDKSFKAFKRYGVKEKSPTYFGQVQCYMGYAGLERAIFVIQNKNNCDIYTERIYFDENHFSELDQKAFEIITSLFPPDPEHDEKSDVCKWCDFALQCRNPEEIKVDETCWTCQFFRYRSGTPIPVCIHEGHPFEILRKGEKCPDYINMFVKRYIQIGGEKRELFKSGD